jgi:hypothetical protein
LVGFLFHDGIAVCLRPICPGKGPRDGFADIELVLHFTDPSLLERNHQELERLFRIGTSYV